MKCAAASFAAGVAIDLDHLIDYCASYGFTFDLKDLYRVCLNHKLKKFSVVLHSYEVIILLWLAIYLLSLSDVWKAIAIGLTQHVVFDNFANPVRSRLIYFFTYRALKRFDGERLIKRKEKE